MRRAEAARERITQACALPGTERTLRETVLAEIRAIVPFDFSAWLLTDPETEVGTAPLATVPELGDLPTLIRLKYLTPLHRWTTLTRSVSLAAAGPAGSRLWRELLAGYDVQDVASTVLRDRSGCWGFLDLWRCGGPFTAAELRFLDELRPALAKGIRTALLATFAAAPAPAPEGPAVLLLDRDLRPLARTPGTDARLRALLPTPPDRSPVPAAALNVAAQLLAVEAGIDDHPPFARMHLAGGHWIALRAAALDTGGVAVSLETAAPAERLAVYSRAAALTPREHALLLRLAAGEDTRGAAGALGITESTVTDHLKSIFTKTGARGRRELLARACG